ncbi:MAG TPA: TetR family transcriptional regulator [Candidatus Dormibacteraeota bacterium]|nr:TetR family transcriptional regulator [Candidatus Dormibacteraeota bacterium]
MSGAGEADGPRPGLRERKKAKTRASIQEHALRLFRERGYDATTVEQIAEAAEVSPSTFFRYFGSKEDVVLYDPFDPVLIEAFLAQPASLSPIAALRAAMHDVLRDSVGEWLGQQEERADLILSVPELRRAMLDGFVDSMAPFAEALAARTGRRPDDFEVQNLIGAVIGVGLVAWLRGASGDGGIGDYLGAMDRAFAHLEAGLPIEPESPARSQRRGA